MASLPSNTAIFRSATDFPKSVQALDREPANALYEEMRTCLIFTNRSRAQLIRRNLEHKDKALSLRDRINHFQTLIDQLQAQKQSQLEDKESLIAQLASEVSEMGAQLDTLSVAFDAVGDIEAEGETHWGRLLFPTKIGRLLQAVRSLMQWWHHQDDERALPESGSTSLDIVEVDTIDEQHRRDYPHLYTDQASMNRDALDR